MRKKGTKTRLLTKFLLGIKNSDRSKSSKNCEYQITNKFYLVPQVVHTDGEVLLSAKAEKLFGSVQNFEKNLQRSIVGEKVSKKFRYTFFGRKVRPKCLVGTPETTRPWKSTFSSKNTEKVRERDNIHNVSPTKKPCWPERFGQLFQQNFFVLPLCLQYYCADNPHRLGDIGIRKKNNPKMSRNLRKNRRSLRQNSSEKKR